ncbi:MAG: hypothetical protein ACE5JP_02040 [Candidatus Bipolaricaulia bacterium]
MPRKKEVKSDRSLVRVGDLIFEALTQQEIAHLFDALFKVLPSDIRDKMLEQLQPDTRQTVRHILSPPKATEGAEAKVAEAKSVSKAKLEQTWSGLWDKWDGIVGEAAREDGAYMAQDAHWEPPYFDSTAFIDDLEGIAGKMRPLLQTAFQNGFSPDMGFAQALREAEEAISGTMPEWMEIVEGFYLEENLTICLLKWEWFSIRGEGQDAFAFAQRILDWENRVSFVTLERNAFLDFFLQLSEADQRAVFEGLTRHDHENTPLWKERLENTFSHWHALYMYCVGQYAPERYLDKLRATIPQHWQNGLPVIEDLLAKEDYRESLRVIQETLNALLESNRSDRSWTPETSLLFTIVTRFYYDDANVESHKNLLRYYQQTAKGLDQSQRVNALELQLIAFDHFFDWQTMFNAFEEVSVPTKTRQALFRSWQDHIIQRAKPSSWEFRSESTKIRKTWWLHWLIESIVDTQRGPSWFQKKIDRWPARLPGERTSLGEDYGFLRLLTKDLTEISGERNRYPKFYGVVVRPRELSTPDDTSRQEYLKRYAPDGLLDRVMAYWKGHLQDLVPRPETARRSDYTEHARWMAALNELAPQSCEALLDRWRVEHRRRRNLWKALKKMGLG